jgi:hypothetical protein
MLLRQGERCLVAKGFLFLSRSWGDGSGAGAGNEDGKEEIYTIDRSDE